MSCTRETRSSLSVTITWFAPSASNSSSLSILRVVAIEIAPSALTVSMAASPTLLDAAVISANSPFLSWPTSIKAPYAVIYCIQIEVASVGVSCAGGSHHCPIASSRIGGQVLTLIPDAPLKVFCQELRSLLIGYSLLDQRCGDSVRDRL